MEKRYLTHEECFVAAKRMAGILLSNGITINVYGVPRGGIPVAYLLAAVYPGPGIANIVERPEDAHLFVDDIVDSGRTREHYVKTYKNAFNFLDLTSYLEKPKKPGQWIVFPWEVGKEDTSAEDIVIRLLQYVGEDVTREGLKETPQRVLKAWKEWTAGYSQNPAEVIKTFEDGAERYDEMIVVRDIPFFSTCEHHLCPFFGTATIAYVPQKRVIGLSKLSRVLDVFSKRLQVQERLTAQVADCLVEHLNPKGVGVLIKARHLCCESRGIAKQGHSTITSAMRGVFFEEGKARSEFLSLAQ